MFIWRSGGFGSFIEGLRLPRPQLRERARTLRTTASRPPYLRLRAPNIVGVRIVVVAVGRLRPPFADDVHHYQKLLARHVRLELAEVRADEQVPRRIPDRAFLSLLDRGGEPIDSIQFSHFLEQRRQSGRDLCFVVGGPYGLDLDAVDLRFSLGKLTLPHQLAQVVLLEQLYRAHKILAGEPYHY
jgi:23S rRNA (pseudouridine1915-N3)-methyltransferase